VRTLEKAEPYVLPTFATDGPRFAAFCENFIIHTKGPFAGRPLILEDWQRRFIDEALRFDPETGIRIYQTVVLGIPRKNGKSTLCAALGIYLCLADGEHSPEVVIAAGSVSQADPVYGQMRHFIENPRSGLGSHFKSMMRAITCPVNLGVIKILAATGKRQFGLNPSAAIMDEKSLWNTAQLFELDTAIKTAMGARDNPLSLTITTAGFDQWTPFGKMYTELMNRPDAYRKDALTIVKDYPGKFLFWWYGSPEDADYSDPEIWMAVNPASWITADKLAIEFNSPDTTPEEFRMFHMNQWVKARDSWLPSGVWAGLTDDKRQIPDGEIIHVGVDASQTHDCTAVSWAWRDPEDGKIITRCHIWAAMDDAAAHEYMDGKIDLREVGEWILEKLAKKYRIKELIYDPRFFDVIAMGLKEAGVRCAPIGQNSGQMADMYQHFYIGCREGRLVHDTDKVWAEHIESTLAKKTEHGWKVSKLGDKRIDGTVAAVIAYGRAAISKGKRTYVFRPEDEDEQV
jgi:phage terminase large subunit-like protein